MIGFVCWGMGLPLLAAVLARKLLFWWYGGRLVPGGVSRQRAVSPEPFEEPPMFRVPMMQGAVPVTRRPSVRVNVDVTYPSVQAREDA